VERKGFIWLTVWEVLVCYWLVSLLLGLVKKHIMADMCGREKLLTSCSWSKREGGSHWGSIIDHEFFNSLLVSKFPLTPNHKSKQQMFNTWVIWEIFNTKNVSPVIMDFWCHYFPIQFHNRHFKKQNKSGWIYLN
jgi:hypothetical protein